MQIGIAVFFPIVYNQPACPPNIVQDVISLKKVIAIGLVLVLLLALAACGQNGSTETQNNPQYNGKPETTAVNNAQTPETTSAAGNPSGGQTADAPALTGKLHLINPDDRDSSILRGVSVYGNRAGSTDFNSKIPATENIRCAFELNEYVGFIPDTDQTYGIKVWILKHREDQSSYETTQFADQMPGFANYCDLHFDTDEPERNYWGEFYLNPDDCEPGYYDFVFVYEGKAIATLLTRFYGQDELSEKTDEELANLK